MSGRRGGMSMESGEEMMKHAQIKKNLESVAGTNWMIGWALAIAIVIGMVILAGPWLGIWNPPQTAQDQQTIRFAAIASVVATVLGVIVLYNNYQIKSHVRELTM